MTSHKGGKRYRITLGKDANGMRVRRWLGTDEAGAKAIHKEIIKRIKNGDINFQINDKNSIKTSFPNFILTLKRIVTP